jgi:DivIVA domain-containing protein
LAFRPDQEGALVLTPEDVVNKRFTVTKFREGYDQDEVDDFLDTVVVEFRRLAAENEELRVQLGAAQSGGSEPAPKTPSDFPAAAPALVSSDPQETTNSHSLLQLARKLHEEHVREGLAKRDQLIRDGQESASRIMRDAETQARNITSQLELDRKAIENSINELREFENDYRGRLREYIENQLEILVREESFEAADAAYEAVVTPELGSAGDSQANTESHEYSDNASRPVVFTEGMNYGQNSDESEGTREDNRPGAN